MPPVRVLNSTVSPAAVLPVRVMVIVAMPLAAFSATE